VPERGLAPVRFLRFAEVEGRYADVLTTLSGRVA
jgi:hypothetical protein